MLVAANSCLARSSWRFGASAKTAWRSVKMPHRALGALQPPAGLIQVHGLASAHAREQLLVGIPQSIGSAREDRVDAAGADARRGTRLRTESTATAACKRGPAREASDLPWGGFHAFRHTCASILFGEGRNAVQVQRWLGHHSAAFTLATYVHLLDGDLGGLLAIPQTVRNDAK